jgi:hypothetical protein
MAAPLRLIGEGDEYGYNYNAHVQSGDAWLLGRYRRAAVEGYIGLQGGLSALWREGIYQKGLFADNSKGDSEHRSFFTYDVKLGAVYKISGAHNLSVNAAVQAAAPYFQDAFAAPRTRNTIAPHLTTEKRLSADATYSLRTPWIRARLTGFYGQLNDQTKAISFYDDINRTFGNLSLSGIDQQHYGVELGLDAPLSFALKGLSVKGALSMGEYTYSSSPLFNEYYDNSGIAFPEDAVHWQGLHVGGTPQTAASLGLGYRGSGYGFLNGLFVDLTASYYDRYYIDIAPNRRTDDAIKGIQNTSKMNDSERAAAIARIRSQERFDPAFLLGININKLWYVGRQMLGVNLSVNNLLNDQTIRSGGYEQMRMYADAQKSDASNNVYVPFASKYYYMFGTSYYLNVYYRF